MTDSPPPFAVTFRSHRAPVAVERVDSFQLGLYQLGLELVGLVDQLIDTEARIQLRSRLDLNTTRLALDLGRAASEVSPSERRRLYRNLRPVAVDCATILDILVRRRGSDRDTIEQAGTVVAALIEQLQTRGAR
jgi:hypothetical protein